jgi:limonene-1,2-epoxide hydrolase
MDSTTNQPTTALPPGIAGFLAAINDRDANAAGAFLTDDIAYHLIVPHPPVTGHAAVIDVLRTSITEADRVRWEVVCWSATGDLVFVERIDRFWFGEREAAREAAIECTGVFELRDGKIATIRDYADLSTWRERKRAALDQ